jgi:hypothetical protein
MADQLASQPGEDRESVRAGKSLPGMRPEKSVRPGE